MAIFDSIFFYIGMGLLLVILIGVMIFLRSKKDDE